jgi:response regulator RpfG family c-di-GMP phosphodiesterase
MILSDENMTFIKGSKCAELLGGILNSKNISFIPFFLVTAYDNSILNMYLSKYITEVVSKPLSKCVAKKLVQNIQ